ncbi:hypothetical protein B0T13DRAFT_508824 [Neurospora crassa]|nr:hypothetical protein B0T13DRAFT_508824 [Neurospora crassa]
MTNFADSTTAGTSVMFFAKLRTQLLALINVAGTGKWTNPRFRQLLSGLAVIGGAKRFPHIADGLLKDVFIALNLTFIRLLQFLSYDIHAWALMFERTTRLGVKPRSRGPARLLEGLHAMERQRGNRKMRARVFDEVSRGDDEEATLGVDTVYKLIQHNFDGGLSYMFTLLTRA